MSVGVGLVSVRLGVIKGLILSRLLIPRFLLPDEVSTVVEQVGGQQEPGQGEDQQTHVDLSSEDRREVNHCAPDSPVVSTTVAKEHTLLTPINLTPLCLTTYSRKGFLEQTDRLLQGFQ